MFTVLKDLNELPKNPRKYTKDQLTHEQTLKALADIGLDDPSLNILALYSLTKGKYTTLSDTLFKDWISGFKDIQAYEANEIAFDKSATSGSYFDKVLNRPKTVRQVIEDNNQRLTKLEKSFDSKDAIDLIKARIGSELFESDVIATNEKTINERIRHLEASIKQLAADIFNVDAKRGDKQNSALYNFNTDSQTVNLSVMDIINRLLRVHGGNYTPTHSYINEEVVMDFSTSKITIGPKETVYIFPNNNNKHQSHTDQVSTWKYRVASSISNLMAHISKNSLNGTAFISVYLNGVEQPKKISIGPNALGSYDITEMGTSVKFMDRLAIKITTESASQGELQIDNTALTLLKGPT